MAEMLVDSTKLDACLDAEADAIRAKTGDSNDLTFDFANNKGFADAIAAIPSGGGSGILESVKGITFGAAGIKLSDATIENGQLFVDLSGKNVVLSGRLFQTNPVSGLNVTIKCNTLTITGDTPFSLPSSGSNGGSVTFVCNQEYLRFTGQHFTGGTGSMKQFYSFYGLPIYLTSASSSNYGAFSRANIYHLDFWENVATGAMYFGTSTGMDNSTCISLANALKDGAAQTVTYASTPKGRLSSIMGYVESVTRGEDETLETYNRFVADENGTVTLMDFITNTKGWTVA